VARLLWQGGGSTLDLTFKTPWPCRWPLHPRWSLHGGDLLLAASRSDERKCISIDDDDDFAIFSRFYFIF
jgi:hypothetical protein